MVKKRGRREASAGVRRVTKIFFEFKRCSRRSFLCVDGVLGDDGHGVMFPLALRRLRHYFFVYLGSKFSSSCFNAFRCALFDLAVFVWYLALFAAM